MSKLSTRQMILISLFAALTAVGAFISIPIYPVPLTLQTLFTLLAAMTLGSVMGASSQIIYVLLGVIGLPVFAGFKAGIGILFGPTGGFLFGFIISAYIIGKIVELKKEKNIFYYFLAGIIGTIIFIIGSFLYNGFEYKSPNELIVSFSFYQLYSFVLGFSNLRHLVTCTSKNSLLPSIPQERIIFYNDIYFQVPPGHLIHIYNNWSK